MSAIWLWGIVVTWAEEGLLYPTLNLPFHLACKDFMLLGTEVPRKTYIDLVEAQDLIGTEDSCHWD